MERITHGGYCIDVVTGGSEGVMPDRQYGQKQESLSNQNATILVVCMHATMPHDGAKEEWRQVSAYLATGENARPEDVCYPFTTPGGRCPSEDLLRGYIATIAFHGLNLQSVALSWHHHCKAAEANTRGSSREGAVLVRKVLDEFGFVDTRIYRYPMDDKHRFAMERDMLQEILVDPDASLSLEDRVTFKDVDLAGQPEGPRVVRFSVQTTRPRLAVVCLTAATASALAWRAMKS
jgi:hypothetical protein